MRMPRLILAFMCAVIACLGVGSLLNAAALSSAHIAAPSATGLRFVATSGNDTSDCTDSAHPCATVQYAVDMANTGDEIRVAGGVYSDVHVRPRHDVTAIGTVTQVVYISQSVTIRGGYTMANSFAVSDPILNPTTLDAQFKGRVLYVTGNISVTMAGLSIIHGNATDLGGSSETPFGADVGGGVYAVTATVFLTNNLIGNNVTGNASYSFGGGVGLFQARGTLVNNVVLTNASRYGGGVGAEYSPDVTLMANTLSANSAYSGGGLQLLLCDTATVNWNRVSNNVTSGFGGGIEILNSSATLSNNMLDGNTAAYGGGIYVFNRSPVLLNNVIRQNRAARGGGMFLTSVPGGILTNNVVIDNQASEVASGVYLDSSVTQWYHTTLARNQGGDGVGIYVNLPSRSAATTAMTNTVIANQATGIRSTMTALSGQVTLNGVLWFNNGTDTGGLGLILVTHAYTGSPAFLTDGYHLSAVSAAIDRGVDAGVLSDIDGDPRPFGAAPDLGADEYVGPLPKTTYLPSVFR